MAADAGGARRERLVGKLRLPIRRRFVLSLVALSTWDSFPGASQSMVTLVHGAIQGPVKHGASPQAVFHMLFQDLKVGGSLGLVSRLSTGFSAGAPDAFIHEENRGLLVAIVDFWPESQVLRRLYTYMVVTGVCYGVLVGRKHCVYLHCNRMTRGLVWQLPCIVKLAWDGRDQQQQMDKHAIEGQHDLVLLHRFHELAASATYGEAIIEKLGYIRLGYGVLGAVYHLGASYWNSWET